MIYLYSDQFLYGKNYKYKRYMTEYELSKSEKKCIGPCYKAGTIILHPLGIKSTTSKNFNFCPVREIENSDHNLLQNYNSLIENGLKKPLKNSVNPIIDECFSKNIEEREPMQIDMLLPKIDYSDKSFLKIYYDIKSINDAVLWIKNNNKNKLTNTRILDCSLRAFGKDMSYISDGLAEIYIYFLVNYWNKGYPSEPYDKIPEMQNLLLSYLQHYKHKWDKIKNHTEKISKFILNKLN